MYKYQVKLLADTVRTFLYMANGGYNEGTKEEILSKLRKDAKVISAAVKAMEENVQVIQ